MPGPGQKSVTLPAELVDEAAVAAKAEDRTTAAFIARAVRAALDGAAASSSTQPSTSPPAVTPAPAQATAHATTSTQPRATEPGEPARTSRAPRATTDVHESVSTTTPPVPATPAGISAAAPPLASRPHPVDEAPGPGAEQVAAPVASPSPKTERSPQPAPVVAPPSTARAVSTWTCPRCHVEMPLEERKSHRESCTDQDPPVPLHAAVVQYADERRLIRFVTVFFRGAREQPADRREAYLAAAVQAGYRDQGLAVPSDAEALELLHALASKEPAIERALEYVPMSFSTPTSRKEGSRGRV